MSQIKRQDLEHYEQQLGQRREVLRWIIHDALVESKREDFVELAGTVHDAGEESVADLLEGVGLATREREVAELVDVEAALARIHGGSFGVCIDCSEDIPRARLDAQPTAERCAACQNRYERAHSGGHDATPSL